MADRTRALEIPEKKVNGSIQRRGCEEKNVALREADKVCASPIHR